MRHAMPVQLQHAAVPFLLGRIYGKKGGGGETLPWTDACGNRIGAGRGRRGHRIDARNVARPGGVDAQGRVQRSENPRL